MKKFLYIMAFATAALVGVTTPSLVHAHTIPAFEGVYPSPQAQTTKRTYRKRYKQTRYTRTTRYMQTARYKYKRSCSRTRACVVRKAYRYKRITARDLAMTPQNTVHGAINWIAYGRLHMHKTGPQLGLPGSLWCADWVNLIERKHGRPGTGSRLARSYAGYGSPSNGNVGDIAVMRRGWSNASGHVGYVSGNCPGGKMILSGNHNRRVQEACYPHYRFIAFRAPPRTRSASVGAFEP